MKVFKILLLISIVTLSISSCNKFMDVGDTNPNVASNPDLNYILPSAEIYIAHSVGYNYQVVGAIWAQYWTQSPFANQYRVMDQYSVAATFYDRPWSNLYAGALADLKQIENRARAGGNNDYLAVSLLLQAYSFQLLADAHGDIPFSDALQAQSAGNFNPTYDNQKDVYKNAVKMVDEATSIIKDIIANHSNTSIGSDDVIYHGDLEQWEYFANTLKLKMALRWSEADPGLAQGWIGELNAAGAKFIGQMGDPAFISYTSGAGNRNPLYENIIGLGGTQNLWASATCVDSMQSNADPRVDIFYYTPSGAQASGIPQGSFGTTAGIANGSARMLPSYNVGALSNAPSATASQSALAPVILISSAEGLLLLAEAEARGWFTAGAGDQADFEAAIQASFADWELASTDADAYIMTAYWGMYPASGSVTDKVRHIITQKWFSMCGTQGFEAWTEQRRTGFPDFFTISEGSQIGNNFPQRLIYPSSEISSNQNFPGQKLITDKVEWDVN